MCKMQTPSRRTDPTGESPPLTGKRWKDAMDYLKREDSGSDTDTGSDTGEPIEQTAENIQEAIDDIKSELQKLTKKYNKKANMEISNNSNLDDILRQLENEKNENQRIILNNIYIYMQDIETLQKALQTKPIMTPAPKRAAYIDLLENKLQKSKDKLQTYEKRLRFNKKNQERILTEIERAKKWIDTYTKRLTELYSKMPSSPSQTPRLRL